jgi:hypothetical protein
VIHPVIAGHGPTLLQGIEHAKHLELLATKRMKSGVTALHFRRRSGKGGS